MAIISPLPSTLTNGTTADATQVMADLNQIFNNVNANAAENGANSSITSLSGLTTPLSIAQGGTGSGTVAGAFTNIVAPGGTITGAVTMTGGLTMNGNALTMIGAAINETQAADIASAATINLDTATGNIVRINGNSNISAVTLSNGRTREAIFNSNGGQLTAGVSLVPPGSANFTWQSNDVGIFSAISGVIYFTPLNRVKQPTITFFSAGASGTYNTPVGAVRLRVRAVGGGGGGAGTGGNGGNGGNTTFGLISAGGGVGGATAGGPTLGGGGSGATLFFNGGGGGGQNGISAPGGMGGGSYFGGGGGNGALGQNGSSASPVGTGGGGCGGTGGVNGGAGGSAGAYCESFITSPAASFVYSVGLGGTGGTGALTGGAGAGGIIIIEEYYN